MLPRGLNIRDESISNVVYIEHKTSKGTSSLASPVNASWIKIMPERWLCIYP